MKLPIQSAPVSRGISAAKVVQQDLVKGSISHQTDCNFAEYNCHLYNDCNACKLYYEKNCTRNPNFDWNKQQQWRRY